MRPKTEEPAAMIWDPAPVNGWGVYLVELPEAVAVAIPLLTGVVIVQGQLVTVMVEAVEPAV